MINDEIQLRAAIYARRSSEKQRNNYSIEAQEDELKNYCNNNNLSIYKMYIDDCYSSKNANRPKFQEMISESENFDIVLVHTYDRFMSNTEQSMKYERILKEKNVSVISITEPIPAGNAGFISNVLIKALAEWRLKNLATHVKKGQKKAAQNGKITSGPPFGYDVVSKEYIINNAESEIVKEIFDMYLSGIGIGKICTWLNENGISGKRGKQFEFATVSAILKNQKYIGYVKFDGEYYNGIHSPILDQDLFEKVQAEIKRRSISTNNKTSSRRSKKYYQYYLLSILHCSCGSSMQIKTSRKNWYAYACGKAIKYTGTCKETKQYKSNIFEKEIESILYQFMNSEIEINFVAENNINKVNSLLAKKNKIPGMIKKIQEGFITGIFTKDEALKRKNELTFEVNEIEKEIDNIKNNKIDIEIYREKIKTIYDAFINETDVCLKRNMLKEIFYRIDIKKDGGLNFYLSE
jgi:site-specific DNA recombinase